MAKTIITSPGAPTTGFTDKGTPSPLAQAIRAGNLLFVSGQGPLDPKTREVVSADIREKLDAMGVEPLGNTQEQMAEWIRREIAKYGPVVKAANIKAE